MLSALSAEIQDWEAEQALRSTSRIYKTSKNYRDPRREALEDYRHHRISKWIFSHECKFIRRLTKRKLRRMSRRELLNETYYKLVPHDYKTYGWITW